MWGLNDVLTHSIAYGMGEEEGRAKAEREKKASNNWHTGTPTERDGFFLIQTKMNNLFLVRWADGFWEETTGDDCLEDNDVVAWQKIEPYKEKEDGRTD